MFLLTPQVKLTKNQKRLYYSQRAITIVTLKPVSHGAMFSTQAHIQTRWKPSFQTNGPVRTLYSQITTILLKYGPEEIQSRFITSKFSFSKKKDSLNYFHGRMGWKILPFLVYFFVFRLIYGCFYRRRTDPSNISFRSLASYRVY